MLYRPSTSYYTPRRRRFARTPRLDWRNYSWPNYGWRTNSDWREFDRLRRDMDRLFGNWNAAPAYPAVMVPHPVSTKDDAALAAMAARVAPDIAARLR